jgi:Co/Zn/Cd efflux system component
MNKSTFSISQMDCPSEETMIRMKLQNVEGIAGLSFDLEKRVLDVSHEGDVKEISAALEELNLGSKFIQTTEIEKFEKSEDGVQKKLLWTVLIINFSFFLIEMIFGWLAGSMGLVADSLDMLADSLVYALSLIAVGSSISRQKQVAGIAGIFQLFLAAGGFYEVVRRFLNVDERPDYQLMIIISILALIANAWCLYLLQKSKSQQAHMKASMIFTSNDILINAGVILAGLMVLWLDSSLPDLIIGAFVFILVSLGAWRILKLAK